MIKPLPYRMRPKTLDDVLGQDELVGKNGFLRKSVEKKHPTSIIFFGPPGTGKTTLAEAYSNDLGLLCYKLNAATSDKKDLVKAIDGAKEFGGAMLIVDEVHRLDKAKQDLLLPVIEDGTIYLLGATTANPQIAIRQAIRSRCKLIEVSGLKKDDIILGMRRAIESSRGLKGKLDIDSDALDYVAKISNGDLRYALNFLEHLTIQFDEKHKITLEDCIEIENVPHLASDKNENEHYDSVSALQKSIRGSDADAAIYYLARLCASRDLESIARRLRVMAYEDVGLANPPAVQRAEISINTALEVGFPEAMIPLGFTVAELALSPKSRASCDSIERAVNMVKNDNAPVREYIKLKPINLDNIDKYPYDRPDLWEKIMYLPEKYQNTQFYFPKIDSVSNYEKSLNSNYVRLKNNGRTANLRDLKKKSR